MNHKEYNGFYNYETWLVNVWLDNDQDSYQGTRFDAQNCYEQAIPDDHFTREERAALDLADMLKEQFEQANPLAEQGGFWADMLGAALSEVNWQELAEHYIADVDKETEEEEA